ncbi:MAG: hypothetical protein Q9191_004461 [Dirinaria sp. TL-2023a]
MSSNTKSELHDPAPSPEDLRDLEECSPASSNTKNQPTGRWTQHFQSTIHNHNTDHVLLFCWLATGLLDSTIFSAYRTFVSMQTGNTMFLGLGASNYNTTTRPYGWAKSLTSLICFCTGAFCFARFNRRFDASKRTTLIFSFLIQASIILFCAILVQTDVVEGRLEYIGDNINWIHEIPIALLSFQAPGQVCLTRDMKFPEVSTVVITTTVYDFGSDPNLLKLRNPVRNRRFFGFAMLLIGAITGGWVTKTTGRINIPMWIAAAIKAGIALAWAVWPSEERNRRWGS